MGGCCVDGELMVCVRVWWCGYLGICLCVLMLMLSLSMCGRLL